MSSLPSMATAPVLIVGAGPAGASLALQLAEAGVPVTLVEASRDFSRQFRGEALMPSGQEALAAMGLEPLLEGLSRRPLDGWSVWIEGRHLFTAEEPLGSQRPCTLVAQAPLLEALVRRARMAPGFTWLPGVAVADLLWENGRARGVRLVDGRCLPACLVVGADGRRSVVRQWAGLALESFEAPLDVLWFRLPSAPEFETPNRFITLVAGGQLASLFAGTTADELQLGWVLPRGDPAAAAGRGERSSQDWANAFAALAPPRLAEHLRQQGERLQGPVRLTVEVGHCPLWQRPGVLLLGDAAHPMSPVRAQGVNMALRDSLVAARLLASLWTDEAAQGGTAGADPTALDAALGQIQSARQPEVKLIQRLQAEEGGRGEALRRHGVLRCGLALGAPLLGPLVRQRWMAQQRVLRDGLPLPTW